MLPGEILALPNLDRAGYQNFLNWIAAGAKQGVLTSEMVPNEAVARVENTPWGENKAYDANGNEISMYRPRRPGEAQVYGGGGGASAPAAPTGAPLQQYLATDVAPRLIQGLQQTLQPPAAAPGTLVGDAPPQAMAPSSTFNPDDMAEWLRKRARGAFVAA